MDRRLVGYSPWGHKESDTTEQLILSLSLPPFVISMMNHAGIILSKYVKQRKTLCDLYVESKLYECVEREYKLVIDRAFGQGK